MTENKIKKLRKLYAIFDKKRMAYLTIMEKTNHAVAMRDFEMIVNAKDGMIKHYPEDYSLDFIGTFDEEDGTLNSSDKTNICSAIEVLKNE